jgi:hypothetical protein
MKNNRTMLERYANTLTIALNSRMADCREKVATIMLTSDVELDKENGVLYSKKREMHFSRNAYQAMDKAKIRINSNEPIENYTALELNQMIKAVGALESGHKELTDYLVDNLVRTLADELLNPDKTRYELT